MSCTTCGSPQPATCGHCGLASALWASCHRAGCQNRKDAEPRVPRQEPEKRCACGRTSPGWCQAILCDRRPMSSEDAAAEPTTIVEERPAEVSLGAATQILDLVEFGFAFTEAASLPDVERDIYAQLVRQRAQSREAARLRNNLRPHLAYA